MLYWTNCHITEENKLEISQIILWRAHSSQLVLGCMSLFRLYDYLCLQFNIIHTITLKKSVKVILLYDFKRHIQWCVNFVNFFLKWTAIYLIISGNLTNSLSILLGYTKVKLTVNDLKHFKGCLMTGHDRVNCKFYLLNEDIKVTFLL